MSDNSFACQPCDSQPADDQYDEGVAYWDTRYTTDPKSADWILKYAELDKTLHSLIGLKTEARILHVGCGNSLLAEHMYDDGYRGICNIDTSAVVIHQMRERNADSRPDLQWLVMDATATEFESGSFDVALDKALLDSLLCEADEDGVLIETYFKELARVVSDDGLVIIISFGPPEERKNKVPSNLFDVEVIEVEAKGKNKITGFHYIYVLRKANRLVEPVCSPSLNVSSLVVASVDPLILCVPEFLSRDSCDVLSNLCLPDGDSGDPDEMPAMLSAEDEGLTEPQRALILHIEHSIGNLTGQPSHGEETPLLPMFSKPTSSESAPTLPSGLHVDTNGGCPRRFAAAILYLTTPVGGETVFPVASSSDIKTSATSLPLRFGSAPEMEVISAAHRLIDAGMLHTRAAKTQPEKHAADTLLHAAEAGVGLAAVAQQGSLVVFWCRHANGDCARSWHSGMKIGPGGEPKLILRKFKSIPESVWHSSQDNIAAYVQQTRSPHVGLSDPIL